MTESSTNRCSSAWKRALFGASLIGLATAAPPMVRPTSCEDLHYCQNGKHGDWNAFRENFVAITNLPPMEQQNEQSRNTLLQLAEVFGTSPFTAMECPIGVAAVFFRLAGIYYNDGYVQRAHNLNQLAMSMFWETTRLPNDVGIQCLEQGPIWGVNWNEEFMQFYLTLAMHLSRHMPETQPSPEIFVPHDYRSNLKIAVMSMCDYAPGHKLYQIDKISAVNREAYTSLHGYTNAFYPNKQSDRHPVEEKIELSQIF